jgi:hypothetical protein
MAWDNEPTLSDPRIVTQVLGWLDDNNSSPATNLDWLEDNNSGPATNPEWLETSSSLWQPTLDDGRPQPTLGGSEELCPHDQPECPKTTSSLRPALVG